MPLATANSNAYSRQSAFVVLSDPKKPKMFDFVSTKWAKAFFGTAVIQAIICIAFESYLFAEFESHVSQTKDNSNNSTYYRSIPTFLTLIIFAFLYELILVWDALRMKNTIQVIGICAANVAFLIYTATQADQIHLAIFSLAAVGAVDTIGPDGLWNRLRPYLVAIPAIIGFMTILLSFIAWKLYQEFAWNILKQIGADYRMKKRFLAYQIYIALLKFDFFFFLGFTVQFLVIVTGKTDVEFALTAAAIPITIFILLIAAFCTRHEIHFGMIASIVLYHGALAWFFFKLVRIYQPGYSFHYFAVRKSLTAFAVLAILLVILTIVNGFVCLHNFGNGLKAHILRRSVDEKGQPDENSIGMSDVKPPLASRMTID